jgi:hypothetical protein
MLLICGNNVVSWADYQRAILVSFSWSQRSLEPRIVQYIPQARMLVKFPISQAIERFGKQRCKDQRDKVYGILNLVKNCCRDAITVDYTMELLQILEMVAMHIVEYHLDAYLIEKLDNYKNE